MVGENHYTSTWAGTTVSRSTNSAAQGQPLIGCHLSLPGLLVTAPSCKQMRWDVVQSGRQGGAAGCHSADMRARRQQWNPMTALRQQRQGQRRQGQCQRQRQGKRQEQRRRQRRCYSPDHAPRAEVGTPLPSNDCNLQAPPRWGRVRAGGRRVLHRPVRCRRKEG